MRALKLALLILALVPTVWLRGEAPSTPRERTIQLVDLMPVLRRNLPDTGPIQLVGAWQICGQDRNLSTLSGLAQTPAGFVAVGDRGGVLWFARPDRSGPWQARLGRLVNLNWRRYRYATDAEAVAVDPKNGDVIVAYEDAPMLERYSPDLAQRRQFPVPALTEWSENQGPEGMALLDDGRLVIVGETYARWLDRTRYPGLLFNAMPRPGENPARFELVMPAGYRPSELAQMPDGRVLVLGRHFTLAGFRSVIAVFAAEDVRPGAVITPHVIARIADPRLRDNYEGMTVTREADGSQMVWLLSDSNEMVWAQRTLLLKLRIGPEVP